MQHLGEQTTVKKDSTNQPCLWSYQKLEDGTLEITGYKGDENIIIIPEQIGRRYVSRIGDECFSARKNNRRKAQRQRMTEILFVSIPSSIKSIGKSAFSFCESLTSIVIQNGLISIGDCAFEHCESLRSISLPGSVASIGKSVFSFCRSLTAISIPRNVTTLKQHTFYNCVSLESIVLPQGLKTIESGAFCCCENLSNIDLPDSLREIGSFVFEDCAKLQSISIPKKIRDISDYAFIRCEGLADEDGFLIINDNLFEYFGNHTFVRIPYGVRYIGAAAFERCDHITKVIIPDSVTSIGSGAFEKCINLRCITIPDSVEFIGTWAFKGCMRIKYAIISKNVKKINPGVFCGCKSLSSIVIPEGVKAIENQAFYDCDNLKKIYIPASVKDPYWVFNKTEDLVIYGPSGCDAQRYAQKIEVRFVEEDTPSRFSDQSELLTISIDELDLLPRTYHCLKRANIYTIDELISYCSKGLEGNSISFIGESLMTIRGMGKKTANDLIAKLEILGLNVRVEYSEDSSDRVPKNALNQMNIDSNVGQTIEERKQMTIGELGLTFKTFNSLKSAHINTVADLLNKSRDDLSRIRYWKAKYTDEIVKRLEQIGFSLREEA